MPGVFSQLSAGVNVEHVSARIKRLLENAVCGPEAGQGLKPRSLLAGVAARLNSLLKNSVSQREHSRG